MLAFPGKSYRGSCPPHLLHSQSTVLWLLVFCRGFRGLRAPYWPAMLICTSAFLAQAPPLEGPWLRPFPPLWLRTFHFCPSLFSFPPALMSIKCQSLFPSAPEQKEDFPICTACYLPLSQCCSVGKKMQQGEQNILFDLLFTPLQ